jgi:hypothetical protein
MNPWFSAAGTFFLWSAFTLVSHAQNGETRHEFSVNPDKSYADYVQFEDGRAQGVCVFYLAEEVDGIDRVVVFCAGDKETGKAYEDIANKRLVVSRTLREFVAFSRFQHDLGDSAVYGIWVTRDDGKVTKFAIQTHRPARTGEPGPAVGQEYTGKRNSNPSSKNE